MRKVLMGLVLALLVVSGAHAQTSYPLPTTGCPSTAYSPSGGGNFGCANIPVTIDGVPYEVTFEGHIEPDGSIAPSEYAHANFLNLNTNVWTLETPTGTATPNGLNFTVQMSFSGAITGSVTLNMIFPVGRYGHWTQRNSVLVVD